MKKLLLFLMWSYLLTSCDPGGTGLTEQKRQVMIDSITATLKNYFSDVRKLGLVAEFKYLDSSADFFWVPPRFSHAISYDSVAAILRKYQTFYLSVDNSWQKLNVRPISNQLASYTGTIRSVSTDTTGRITDFTLIETGIVIKRASGWKLLNGQTSLVETR